MKQYHDLCKHILTNGVDKEDRTGTGTRSIFGYQMRFDLNEGFPLMTTKRIPFNLIKTELLWFIKGYTNIRYLLQHNNHIWDEWAFKRWVESEYYSGPDMTNFGIRSQIDPDFKIVYDNMMNIFVEQILKDNEFARMFGDLGPVYGKQWRNWTYTVPHDELDSEYKTYRIDQLQDVINMIKNNPNSRRMMVSAWNPIDVPSMALPPCHVLFQFYVANGKLSCMLYQRSADTFLGVPFNIASYALLTHMIAHECGLGVGEFVHTLGDTHIYSNHFDQVNKQLEREFRPLPTLSLNPDKNSIFDFEPDDIIVNNYDPHPSIKAPVAV